MGLRQYFKQVFCTHVVAWTDVKRTGPAEVEATCRRCGTVLRAPYGVALDARWEDPTPEEKAAFYKREGK
jgi:hypothetical protein